METDEERVAGIRATVAKLTQEEARAEVEREAALALLEERVTQLKREFNVADVDEAKSLLLTLQEQFREELAALEEEVNDLEK